MIFGENLWRLPMWSDLVRHTNDQTSPTKTNTLALVPTAAALEALAQPSPPDQEAMQFVHDMWCHPGNDKMEQIYKARRGRGFPRGFITQLRKIHCATCAVSKRTRRYRHSKLVKVAAAKRATQARTLRTPKPNADAVLNDSRSAEHAGEQEAQKQGSGTAIEQWTCHGCQRIFGIAQGLASHLKDSYRCPSSSNYQQPTAEPARRVLQRAEASNALHSISALASAVTREAATDLPALRRLHIDYAHSISIGVHKEKYFLLMTLDGIDFTFCSATVDRMEPESLVHEFMTLTLRRCSRVCKERDYIQGVLCQQSYRDGGNCSIYSYFQCARRRRGTHCERTHAVFAAPRKPPTSLLAVLNAALLPRLYLLA
jgi:hypothetical protein